MCVYSKYKTNYSFTFRLFEDLAKHQNKYDALSKIKLTEIAAKFVQDNFGTHKGLYFKYLFLNIVTLFIDVASLIFLNLVFQNRFLTYGIDAFPYVRDPKYFSDFMSQTFPPFVQCELDKHNQITAKRTERLGCHLTYMELYEKFFLFIWFWLVILMVCTSLYIIFLVLMTVPSVKRLILRMKLNDDKCKFDMVGDVIDQSNIGDIYVFYRLRDYFLEDKYFTIMITKLLEHNMKALGSQSSLASSRKSPNTSILIE